MAEEHPWHEAIEVSGIGEEYGYVREAKCFECNGEYEVQMQALLFSEEGNPYDLLTCQCKSCFKEKKFYFDIKSFYGKY